MINKLIISIGQAIDKKDKIESINYGSPGDELNDDSLKDEYQAPDYMKGYKVDVDSKFLPPVRQQSTPDFKSETPDDFHDSSDINITVKGNSTETVEELLNKEENILDVKEPTEKKEDESDENSSESRKIITT